MTICPCCGFKFDGDLRNGCVECGARAVGAPLPKPDHELPAYGRPLLLAISGFLLVIAFLVETVVAMVQMVPGSLGFWSWVAAGETAAWRLKWIVLPLAVVVLWSGRRLYRAMLQERQQYVCLSLARRGMFAASAVTLVIVGLIGVTVPARLEQRRISLEAAQRVPALTLARAQLEYRARRGFFPNNITDLRQLPDPDGSIAAALASIPNVDDPGGYPGYRPSTELAAVGPEKPGALHPTVFRRVSTGKAAEDAISGGVSFTNYELRLPSEDKLPFTDDDLIVRDGVILTVAEARETIAPTRSLSQKR